MSSSSVPGKRSGAAFDTPIVYRWEYLPLKALLSRRLTGRNQVRDSRVARHRVEVDRLQDVVLRRVVVTIHPTGREGRLDPDRRNARLCKRRVIAAARRKSAGVGLDSELSSGVSSMRTERRRAPHVNRVERNNRRAIDVDRRDDLLRP